MTESDIRVERATRASRTGGIVMLVLMVVLATMPWWARRSDLRLVVDFMSFLALAQMWNLLAGYGGLISIGQQAYIGIGGYALVALSMHFGVNPYLAVPLAGLIAVAFAVPSAALLFRLQGPQFAVGTWVVAEVFRLTIANTERLGGGTGTSLVGAMEGMSTFAREATTLWLSLAIGAGSVVAVYALLRSRRGLELIALRDSETAAESIGVGVPRMKWMVYVVAAFGCGAVGALVYLNTLRISPDAAFGIEWTAFAIFIAVIGGVGRVEGPIVGTIAFFLLREGLADLGSWYMVILGLVAIVVTMTAPQGLWGAFSTRTGIQLFPIRRRLLRAEARPDSRSDP